MEQLLGQGFVNFFVPIDDNLAGFWVGQRCGRHSAQDAVGQRSARRVARAGDNPKGVQGFAVFFQHDYFLGNVDQAPGQVAAVGGPQGGIGQTLTGAVGGYEILQRGQTFPEAGLDGQVYDLALGVGHQTAHSGHLLDLGDITLGSRHSHHCDATVVGQIGLYQLFGLV